MVLVSYRFAAITGHDARRKATVDLPADPPAWPQFLYEWSYFKVSYEGSGFWRLDIRGVHWF